jgi:hypothetical protein
MVNQKDAERQIEALRIHCIAMKKFNQWLGNRLIDAIEMSDRQPANSDGIMYRDTLQMVFDIWSDYVND